MGDYVVLGLANFVIIQIQTYFFRVAGGKLITHIRSMCFDQVVHQKSVGSVTQNSKSIFCMCFPLYSNLFLHFVSAVRLERDFPHMLQQ